MLQAINCNKAFDAKLFAKMQTEMSTDSLLSNTNKCLIFPDAPKKMTGDIHQLPVVLLQEPAAFIILFSTIFQLYLWMPMLQYVKTNSSEELLQERDVSQMNLLVSGNVNIVLSKGAWMCVSVLTSRHVYMYICYT